MTTESKELEPWRLALDALSLERKRQIAESMVIHVHTLQRWGTGIRTPHKIELVQQLSAAAPELREDLKEAYPEAFNDSDNLQISTEILFQHFRDKSLVAKDVNVYTLTNNALEQAASLLDPLEEGLIIQPFFCVLNEQGAVTHMRTGEAYGTGPWRLQQTTMPYDVGRNSLNGKAVMQMRPFFFPQHPTGEHTSEKATPHFGKIESAAIYPLQRYGSEIAGTLLYVSVHKDFFTQARREVCQQFAYVFAAGLFDHQFYPSPIKLEPLPENRKDTENV